MSNQLKTLHDRLLAEKPEDATHTADKCPLCALELDDNGGTNGDTPEGGSMSEQAKYTLDDLKAAFETVSEARKAGNKSAVTAQNCSADVAAIIAMIDQLVDQLLDQLGIPDTDASGPSMAALDAANAKIAELQAQLKDGQVSELQKQLDAAVLQAETEKKAREELEAKIVTDEQAKEEAAQLEVRKAERLVQVKEVASFPEEHLVANADRWAKLPEDEFAKLIEDWKVIASKSDAVPPSKTAMTAGRVEGGDQPQSALSHLGEISQELVGAKRL